MKYQLFWGLLCSAEALDAINSLYRRMERCGPHPSLCLLRCHNVWKLEMSFSTFQGCLKLPVWFTPGLMETRPHYQRHKMYTSDMLHVPSIWRGKSFAFHPLEATPQTVHRCPLGILNQLSGREGRFPAADFAVEPWILAFIIKASSSFAGSFIWQLVFHHLQCWKALFWLVVSHEARLYTPNGSLEKQLVPNLFLQFAVGSALWEWKKY